MLLFYQLSHFLRGNGSSRGKNFAKESLEQSVLKLLEVKSLTLAHTCILIMTAY